MFPTSQAVHLRVLGAHVFGWTKWDAPSTCWKNKMSDIGHPSDFKLEQLSSSSQRSSEHRA